MRAWIITCMTSRMNKYFFVFFVDTFERFFICACHSDSHIKDFTNPCSLSIFINSFTTKNIICGNSSLAVCGSRERNNSRKSAYKIFDFNGISNSINRRVSCFHLIINNNSSPFSCFQSGIFCELNIRFYTDSQNSDSCFDSFTGTQGCL